MKTIQNYLMKDGDPNNTPSVDEMPAVSESIPPQPGPSGEIVEPTVLSGSSFQADLENQLRRFKEIQLDEIPQGTEFTPIGPVATLTKLVISRVYAPPLVEPIYRERTVTPAMPLHTVAKSSAKPTVTVPRATVGGGDSGNTSRSKIWRHPKIFWD